MENADEIGDVVRTEAEMPSTKQESTDYPFARLRGVLSRMNLYVEKVENLRRKLEESEKCIKLLQEQNALMETAHSEKRPQQAVDGTGDAPPCSPALLDHIEELEDGLENRLQQLEQLLERRSVVHVGVQTDVGEADLAEPSHSRRSWWPAAAIVLSSTSVSLVIAGLLNSVWAGGLDEVVIHIDPQSL